MADSKEITKIWELNQEELLEWVLNIGRWPSNRRFFCKDIKDWEFWRAYFNKTLNLITIRLGSTFESEDFPAFLELKVNTSDSGHSNSRYDKTRYYQMERTVKHTAYVFAYISGIEYRTLDAILPPDDILNGELERDNSIEAYKANLLKQEL